MADRHQIETILLVSELLLYAGDKAYVSGSTYSLALLGLDEKENPDVTYDLVMTNTDDDAIDVTITDIGDTMPDPIKIPAYGQMEEQLTQPSSMNASGVDNKTIHVHSAGNFTLQVFANRGSYVEGFLAIPIEDLAGPRQISGAYEYITTTFCATSGFCQIAVSAFENNTGISFKFPPESEEIVFCYNNSFFRSLRDRIIYLDRFQSVQFETAADLTGVRIYSFKPISVFVGSRNITQGADIAHMVEQLHPSSQWGTQYAVRTLNDLGYGDLIRIATHWPNTTIDMKGFPVFVMTNWTQSVWRRLDKGMRSFITASKPIQTPCRWRRLDKGIRSFITASKPMQVVQVTGLMYATEGEQTMAAMTVVPAIENSARVFEVSCGKGSTNDEFHIVSGNNKNMYFLNNFGRTTRMKVLVCSEDDWTTIPASVDEKDVDNTEGIEYTLYGVGDVTPQGADVYHVEGTTDVTGIVKCKRTAVMPLGLKHKALMEPPPSDTPVYHVYCKEMLHGSTSFNPQMSMATKPNKTNSGESPVKRHTIMFGDFKILQLRTRTCGRLNIQFLENNTTIENRLLFIFTKNTVYVHKCYPKCNGKSTEVDTSSYNEDYNCKTDMLLYWFRLMEEGGAKKLCYGTGPFADRTACENGIDITEFFVRALLLATPGDAYYNYDLETEESCDFRESEWRCEDKSPVCERYGPNICTAEADYARTHCAKFCQRCTPDSYGRKFIVLAPKTNCYIHVTGYMTTPTVAVGTKTKLLSVEQDFSQDRTMVYSCPTGADGDTDPVTVIADADVSVSVIYRQRFVDLKSMSYPVYPVDSYGSEYMLFGEFDPKMSPSKCEFITEYHSIDVVPHEVDNVTPFPPTSVLSVFNVGYDNVGFLFSSGKYPIGLFASEKPFSVVCSHRFFQMTSYQLVPTSSWGTHYLVPKFEDTLADLPFDISLKIITNRDNTVVNIDGDFNAVHPLYKRGNEVEQEITGAATYTVTATHPISVAVVFKDIGQPDYRTFHVLPPSDGFLGAQINTIPASVLQVLPNYMFEEISAATYFVTRNATSRAWTSYFSGLDELWKTDYQTARQFGISVVRSEDGWMSLSGPRTFKTYSPASLCHTDLPATPGDNIDNDCDGLIDEDTSFSGYAVYSNDFDLDGMFNDDSCCQDTTKAILEKPTDPACLEILKPANQCWVVWSGCNCEWLTSLANYNNMTEEEKAALHAKVARQQKANLAVNQTTLSATTRQKGSASDERQSAADIGYVGIALFACVFGTIFIMDLHSLYRDICITFRNICEGVDRLKDFCKRCKQRCGKLRGNVNTGNDVGSGRTT